MKKIILFTFLLFTAFSNNTNAQQEPPSGWSVTNWSISAPRDPNHANPNGLVPYSDQVLGYGEWTTSTTTGNLQTSILDVSKLQNGLLKVDVAYNEYFMQFMDFSIIAVENSNQTILWEGKYQGLTYLNWRTVTLDLSQYSTPKLIFIFNTNDLNLGDLVIVDVGKLLSTGAFANDSITANTPPVITWKSLTSYIIWVGGITPIFLPGISYSAWDEEDGDLTDSVKFIGIENVNVNSVGVYTVIVTVEDSKGARDWIILTIQVIGTTDVDEDNSILNYKLSQNYPNPFNPTTKIRFFIPEASFVTLKIYNLLGQEVAILVDEEKSAGTYEVNFDAQNLPSGMYIYRIIAKNFVETKKMTLLK